MRVTRLAVLAAITTAGLALAACSSGDLGGGSTTDPGAAEELIPVTVGLLPIAPAAAVQLGIDEGIFAEHGLDVTIEIGQGGAALLPAVSSGSIQFAVGNPLSVLVAASQGLEMSIIAGYSRITEPAPSGIVVLESSGIESWTDLEGKTVALNAVNTQGDLTTKAQVENAGGDPDAVTFTEIPFPDQLAQLEQGNIDASWTPEPFLSTSLDTPGVVFLGDPLSAIDDLYTMVTFSSTAYVDANPEIAEAFAAAITESTALAMSDEELYRDAIAGFTGMPAEVVETIRLERLSGELDRSTIEELSALALRFGFVDSEPDLDVVIWE
jgi:ABC-type nitrate/sulfonate/bicarbonate transport systems, periplasmic components